MAPRLGGAGGATAQATTSLTAGWFSEIVAKWILKVKDTNGMQILRDKLRKRFDGKLTLGTMCSGMDGVNYVVNVLGDRLGFSIAHVSGPQRWQLLLHCLSI